MNIGSIKIWLNLHTYFGLIGFLLVMLHAGFPFQFRYTAFNAGTVSTYLMNIAVLSGFIGRYLYRLMDKRGKKYSSIKTLIRVAPPISTCPQTCWGKSHQATGHG